MIAPEYYIFDGRGRRKKGRFKIPQHVSHVIIDRALKSVPANAFWAHPNIQEVICHDGVLKIGKYAFYKCPSLRRVIMPSVKRVEDSAFNQCRALSYIECGKLEIIEDWAFEYCRSLSSIDLSSIKILGMAALRCTNLISASFGNELESIGPGAFNFCRSLERITLPLKDGMITADDAFRACDTLESVDLVDGAVLDESIASFLLEEWRNDMNEEIDTINQILRNTSSGDIHEVGGKAQTVRAWIKSVHRKYTHYKALHERYLNMAAALEPALPNDIVLNNVLPFLAYTLDGED